MNIEYMSEFLFFLTYWYILAFGDLSQIDSGGSK